MSEQKPLPDNRGHRAVGGAEQDVSRSLLHGYCAVCVTPWPCDSEKELHAARLEATRARPQAAAEPCKCCCPAHGGAGFVQGCPKCASPAPAGEGEADYAACRFASALTASRAEGKAEGHAAGYERGLREAAQVAKRRACHTCQNRGKAIARHTDYFESFRTAAAILAKLK
jgi:flagellar biosynthesis/type III secretory pathway protein FliH